MSPHIDLTAVKIGAHYRSGLAAHIEAGRLLAKKKASLKHGAWLLWLKTNADALGFGELTAQRLMKLAGANPSPAMDSTGAITRQLWGHTGRGHAKPSIPPQYLFTSLPHVALVKKVFGGEIDTDPSSCAEANAKYVKAKNFYSVEQDGLTLPWHGRVYVNPMFPDTVPFVDKLIEERTNGNCSEAILLSNNRTGSPWFQKVFAHASAICFPKVFVPFHAPKTGKAARPAFCVFSYFGPNDAKFAETFQKVGSVWRPW